MHSDSKKRRSSLVLLFAIGDVRRWRDATGHEIDVLVDLGEKLVPLEIKSGQTVASDFFKNLKYWQNLAKRKNCPSALVYGGDKAFRRSGVTVYPWFAL